MRFTQVNSILIFKLTELMDSQLAIASEYVLHGSSDIEILLFKP